MKHKRWARLVAVFAALVLVLGACGGRDDDDAAPEPDPTPTEPDENGEEPVEPEPVGDPEPTAGFDGETIRLGVLTPTSGVVSIIGNPLTAGNQAYIDYVNEELGGIAGRYRLELVIEDTVYDPTIASQRYPAIRDDVVMFVQVLGTPIVNALLPDLIDDGIAGAPASLDSAWVREPNLVAIGSPYQIQAINGIDWFFSQPENEGMALCTLASDDEYGDTGVEGAEFAAENLGIEIVSQATFPAPSPARPPQTFEAQIAQLQGAGCEVILFVATPTDTGAYATTLLENTAYNPITLGLSPTWLGLFAGNAYLQEYYFQLSMGTEYGDDTVPGMVELERIHQTYAPDQAPDVYFNFGFMQAMAVVQILEEAVARGDLSRAGIMAAMESVGTLTFDGLAGDYVYGPVSQRVPPIDTSMFRPNPDKPMGLELVARDHVAPYAGDFSFD